jgi:hypothetical protein
MREATAPQARTPPLRPAQVCSALLAALEAADGRRRMRKRDQTPDAIGLGAKRALLECVVREDPDPEAFEAWLLQYAGGDPSDHGGAAPAANSRSIFEEWRLAHVMGDFTVWLACGAPSEDAGSVPRAGKDGGSGSAPASANAPTMHGE